MDELPATALAAIKGFSAGLFNIIVAAVIGLGTIDVQQIGGALLIGAFCYGVSLVLFIGALRKIGSSRSSTYFAIGPFIGVLSALVLLREHPPVRDPTSVAKFFYYAGENEYHYLLDMWGWWIVIMIITIEIGRNLFQAVSRGHLFEQRNRISL